jgi:hypothetical protein
MIDAKTPGFAEAEAAASTIDKSFEFEERKGKKETGDWKAH